MKYPFQEGGQFNLIILNKQITYYVSAYEEKKVPITNGMIFIFFLTRKNEDIIQWSMENSYR